MTQSSGMEQRGKQNYGNFRRRSSYQHFVWIGFGLCLTSFFLFLLLDMMLHMSWKQWFFGYNEFLGASPFEASRTSAGRQKLEEQWRWYDTAESGIAVEENSISGRPPEKYARWKLDMGPGSAQEFSHEERIFYGPAAAASRASAYRNSP